MSDRSGQPEGSFSHHDWCTQFRSKAVGDGITDAEPRGSDRMKHDAKNCRAKFCHQVIAAHRCANPSLAFVAQVARGFRTNARFDSVPGVDFEHETSAFHAMHRADAFQHGEHRASIRCVGGTFCARCAMKTRFIGCRPSVQQRQKRRQYHRSG
jgi:hypothetical protein